LFEVVFTGLTYGGFDNSSPAQPLISFAHIGNNAEECELGH
jgi:hypothetical protein